MANYDDFLYSDYPHAETHPSRLYALGRLLGLSPAHPSRCRVLELGCGLGGNVIAMAAALPESEFLGIDLSARQIAAGADLLRTLSLRNVTLRAEDIRDFPIRETYDYILCHGIYSWVPDDVQARILEIAGSCLGPQGLCYISYNTLPGWHMRGMVRDMLRRAAGEGGEARDRIARARDLLAFLGHLPDEQGAAQAFLASEINLLGQLGDEYLLYEHLVDRNRPQYFDDFAAAAARAGLSYVGDAHFGSALPSRFPPDVLEAAGGDNQVATEARLDLLEVRLFRRSVLCRAAAHPAGVAGTGGPFVAPTWERLQGLHVTTSLQPLTDESDLGSEEAEDFRGPGNRGISAHRPLLKAALRLLHEERPMGMAFEALCDAASAQLGKKKPRRQGAARAELGQSLLDLLSRGFIELHGGAPAMAPRPGPRPRVTELARLQASRGQAGCTNLRNECIAVDDLDRCLLRRLDGGYALEELGELVLIDSRAGGFTLEMNGEPVVGREAMTAAARRRLEMLARSAFLLG